MTEIQYVSDENGNPVGVIVPIELWQDSLNRIPRKISQFFNGGSLPLNFI